MTANHSPYRIEFTSRMARRLYAEADGVTSVEYALVASLIAMAVVGALRGLGGVLVGLLNGLVGSWP